MLQPMKILVGDGAVNLMEMGGLLMQNRGVLLIEPADLVVDGLIIAAELMGNGHGTFPAGRSHQDLTSVQHEGNFVRSPQAGIEDFSPIPRRSRRGCACPLFPWVALFDRPFAKENCPQGISYVYERMTPISMMLGTCLRFLLQQNKLSSKAQLAPLWKSVLPIGQTPSANVSHLVGR